MEVTVPANIVTRLRTIFRLAGLVAFALAVAAVWILVLPPASASQPVEFNHAKHQPIACSTCHPGVVSGAKASLPAGIFCAKCHATSPATLPEGQWERLTGASPASWVPLTRLPAHVRFSHERHVGAGKLECASCHGDIGKSSSPVARNPVRLEMNTCLACHRQENVTEDCAACHR